MLPTTTNSTEVAEVNALAHAGFISNLESKIYVEYILHHAPCPDVAQDHNVSQEEVHRISMKVDAKLPSRTMRPPTFVTKTANRDALQNPDHSGFEQKWTTFLYFYRDFLLARARRLVPTEENAECVLSDVFLAIQEGNVLENYRAVKASSGTPFRGYVLSVIDNKAKDWLKRQKTRRITFQDPTEMATDRADASVSVGNVLHLEEWWHATIEAALRYLLSQGTNQGTIEIFRSHVLHELSAQQTATRHNVTVPKVQSVKSRLKQRLINLIEWQGDRELKEVFRGL